MNKLIEDEIKSLEEVTNKCCGQLNNYYYKCYQKMQFNDSYATQFDYEQHQERANDLILALLRDYALFDEDNSDMIDSYNLDNDDLFNCCGPTRLL